MKYFIAFLVGVVFAVSALIASAQETFTEINSKHIECMAKAIYFESRNEPLAGQLAVGLVVKNRSMSDIFPKDICLVVYEGRHDARGIPIINQCQFSWYCDGLQKRKLDMVQWERALYLAKSILMGSVLDFTDGALFFHSISINPRWNLKRIGSIGNHIFYKRI